RRRERLRGGRQIGAGAERVTGPGDHADTVLVVFVASPVGAPQTVAHRGRERVPALRAVEGHHRDPVADLEAQVAKTVGGGHFDSLSGWLRPKWARASVASAAGPRSSS